MLACSIFRLGTINIFWGVMIIIFTDKWRNALKMFQTLKRMCKSSVVKSIGFDCFSRRRPGGWFPNDVIVNNTIIPNSRHLGFSLCPQRACLHGDGGPLKGEVTYGGLPHLSCKRDQIKMRDYIQRRATPPKRVTSPTWSPPPSCKQALSYYVCSLR